MGDQELRNVNISQNEHDDIGWNGHRQGALDFGWGTFGSPEGMANSPITIRDVNSIMEYTYPSAVTSAYCIVRFMWMGELYKILFGHTDRYASGEIQAGQSICYVGNNNPNGNHLHICAEKNGQYFPIRDFIFGDTWMENPSFPINTKVKFVADTNIRKSSGSGGEIIATVNNSVASISSSDIVVSDGFNWQQVSFLDGNGWSYTGNMVTTDEQVTKLDGTIPKPEPIIRHIYHLWIDSSVIDTFGSLSEAVEAFDKCNVIGEIKLDDMVSIDGVASGRVILMAKTNEKKENQLINFIKKNMQQIIDWFITTSANYTSRKYLVTLAYIAFVGWAGYNNIAISPTAWICSSVIVCAYMLSNLLDKSSNPS